MMDSPFGNILKIKDKICKGLNYVTSEYVYYDSIRIGLPLYNTFVDRRMGIKWMDGSKLLRILKGQVIPWEDHILTGWLIRTTWVTPCLNVIL